jgi:hypothetical protein
MTTQSDIAMQLEPGKSISIPPRSTLQVRNNSDGRGSVRIKSGDLIEDRDIAPHQADEAEMPMGGEVTNIGHVPLTVVW